MENNLTNEGNHSSQHEDAKLQKIVSTIVPTLFGLIGIIALFGNVLVVFLIGANPDMKATKKLLIINLSVADLLFIIFSIPSTATEFIMAPWLFGDWWCKVVQYFTVFPGLVSVYTLVLMSLDRYITVVYPVASLSTRTVNNVSKAIACLWVVSLIIAIPVGSCHGEKFSSCIFLEKQGCSKSGFQIFFFLLSYVIPLTLFSVLYTCMLMKLWKSRKGKKRVTKMTVVDVVVFAVCWLPIQIILLLKAMDKYKITYFTMTVQIMAYVLAYMNICLNPVLTLFSGNFRVAFRKVIYCPLPCIDGRSEPPQPTNNTRTGIDNNRHTKIQITIL